MNEQKQCIADRIELYVRAICDSLPVDEDSKNHAIAMCKDIRGDYRISGKHPRTLAGAIVWLATDKDLKLCDIAEFMGITPPSIYLASKVLYEIRYIQQF